MYILEEQSMKSAISKCLLFIFHYNYSLFKNSNKVYLYFQRIRLQGYHLKIPSNKNNNCAHYSIRNVNLPV